MLVPKISAYFYTDFLKNFSVLMFKKCAYFFIQVFSFHQFRLIMNMNSFLLPLHVFNKSSSNRPITTL